jgi:hypothetical protein
MLEADEIKVLREIVVKTKTDNKSYCIQSINEWVERRRECTKNGC